MSNYANNMPPSATAGAYSGMGMPSYGSPNAEAATNAWANNPPTYTSPAYTSPAPYPHMGYSPMHHCVKAAPVYAATCGGSNTTASILVLFILLVIISRAFLI